MKNKHPEKVMTWLRSKPPLDELGAEFPELRETVRQELAEVIAGGSSGLPGYLKHLIKAEQLLERKYQVNRGSLKIAGALAHQAVRTRIAHLAIQQHLVSEATGVVKGKIRFNELNGFLAQRLLFSEALVRKPVSLFWFRLIWPLVWQRRLLMPLVQPKGIYCFYSRQLIKELAALIGARTCLEIAAGDGTLSRFLAGAGVNVTAIDDHSWAHEVTYPESVIKQDAQQALRERIPETVICSWPPAGNTFEQQVFRTESVQMYIVIGSRHRFAAGNWEDYGQQAAFDYGEDERLSRLVLPPELDSAVYIFRRRL
jgi:hypothetical protein